MMRRYFARSATATILALYALIFFEWLFQVTKISFLSDLSAWDRIAALAIAPLPLVLCALVLLLALSLIAGIRDVGTLARVIVVLMPAAVLAGIQLLLVDNFTRVILGTNVGDATGIWRYICLLVLLLALAGNFRYLYVRLLSSDHNRGWWISAALSTVLIVSSLVLSTTRLMKGSGQDDQVLAVQKGPLPNIIIFATDGVDADRMSAYGYKRQTTPFIDSLLPESLLVENSFANAGRTCGSLVSLLTGKHPTTTRVYYPPNTLRGRDMYEHLPAVLHKLGYYNGEVSLRHYADSIDFNMHDSFDFANYRSVTNPLMVPRLIRSIYATEVYFLERSVERLTTRVLHLSGFRDMVDYYTFVAVDPKNDNISDQKKYFQMIDFLERYPQPFFLHVHMMNTHGPVYYLTEPYFSKGRTQRYDFETDFVDDAIRDYDALLSHLVTYLKNKDMLDNTLLIINADHGMAWQNRSRVPLIFRFPNGEHAGRVSANVQRMDIAPTILDYLGGTPPSWMEGGSLLSGPTDPMRPIISVRIKREKKRNEHGKMIMADMSPPFYALGKVEMVRCNRWASLNLENGTVENGIVEGHTAPCSAADLPPIDQEKEHLVNYLADKGYDITSLRQTKTD